MSGQGGSQGELMRRLYFQKLRVTGSDPSLDRQLVEMVLQQARQVIAHPSKPKRLRLESLWQNPQSDIALEETIEENPFLSADGEFLVETEEEKHFSCVTLLDTSASMSGDKHLLASIAVAVLMLEVPPRDTSLIVFNSEAKPIKALRVDEACEDTVLRFLAMRPRGFTNIEAGLQEGLRQLRGRRGRKLGLIATDGRSTEGEDPLRPASQYDFLIVLHLHGPGSHLEASREIAQAGHGICLEVEKFEELPQRMYDAVRTLARR
jgi:hypothetical protein